MADHAIADGGANRPTMKDVARAAGVSRQLVSLVMRDLPGASPDTRARVADAALALGYVPDDRARKLRQQSGRLIGVAFELQQPFHGDIVEQVYLAAAETGHDVTLSALAPTRREKVALESLLRERCDAVIVLSTDRPPLANLKTWAGRTPLVLGTRRTRDRELGVVRGDDTTGLRIAVEYLFGLGHRRIAHIDGADAPGSADRRASYRRTMRRLGLDADVVGGGREEDAGARAMRKLLARDRRPTAVIAFNDRCAVGALGAAAQEGVKIPVELSVMGYDDSRLSNLSHVQLTTVTQDASEFGRALVDMARSQIDGAAPGEVVVAPRLVVRGTTGYPGAPDEPRISSVATPR